MTIFIEAMSIDYDSLVSLWLSVSFSLSMSFEKGKLSKAGSCANGTDRDCICVFAGLLFDVAMLSISMLEIALLPEGRDY